MQLAYQNGAIVNDYLERLHYVFSENLLLAALDLVDRDNGEGLAAAVQHIN